MKLTDWLSQNNRTVTWLAGQVGRDRSVVSRIKDGRVNPPASIVALIEEATNGEVTASDLAIELRRPVEGVVA